MRFVGKTKVDEKTTLGATVEVQFESNSSAAVSQDDERGVGPNNFTERKLEITAQHTDYGKISVGQGSTASDGISEVDLSKTSVINNSAIQNQAGGLQFRDGNTGMLTGVTIADVFSNFDGLSRDDRVRVDSPKFMGAQISAAAIAGDRYDVAGRWSGKIGPVKAAAAVGHAHEARQESQDRSRLSGSASVLHVPTGINLTAAAGMQDRQTAGRDNPMFYYVKGGWIAEFFGMGPTAFSVDFAKADAVAQNGDTFTSVGAFVVQHLSDHGTELYLGVRHHDLDREGESFKDITVGSVGGRQKF